MSALLRKHYLIDHRILFPLGFIFYLLTPILLGEIQAFNTYPGVDIFQRFYANIPDRHIISYLIICASWIPAFYLGHLAFRMLKPRSIRLEKFEPDFSSRSLDYFAVILIGILALFIYVSRASLFGSGVYDVGPRGKLSTLIIVFNFFLIYQLVTNGKLSYLLVIGTIVNALVLLAAGGRLTAFQTLLILLIFKTSYADRQWKTWHIMGIAFLAFFAGGAIGVWRVNSEFSLERAGFSMLAEPMFTWFSTASFLNSNEIPLFNFPQNFLTSFFNLVPNTFGGLRQYVVSVPDMGYYYENPFGADSIWTTLVINFGSVGSGIFIFFTGFMLSLIRYLSTGSRFWTCYYFLACAMLPLEFFRTGFFILNKQLFFNFLILPGFVIAVLQLIGYLQKRITSSEKYRTADE